MSIQPPKKPAMTPSPMPMISDSSEAEVAISRLIREPSRTRVSTSRPSCRLQAQQVAGADAAHAAQRHRGVGVDAVHELLVRVGAPNSEASSGAKSATSTRRTMTMPAAIATRSFFMRDQAICVSDRPSMAFAAGVPGSGAPIVAEVVVQGGGVPWQRCHVNPRWSSDSEGLVSAPESQAGRSRDHVTPGARPRRESPVVLHIALSGRGPPQETGASPPGLARGLGQPCPNCDQSWIGRSPSHIRGIGGGRWPP